MKKKVETIKSPQFALFPNPNGIPFEEYIKTKRNDENSKFAPFPDPNGISQEEFER